MMQSFVQNLALDLLPLTIAIAVVLARYALNRLPEQQHQIVTQLATTAVQCVEQLYRCATGPDKYVAALTLLNDMLSAQHQSAAMPIKHAAIEAAVLALPPTQPKKLILPAIEATVQK